MIAISIYLGLFVVVLVLGDKLSETLVYRPIERLVHEAKTKKDPG